MHWSSRKERVFGLDLMRALAIMLVLMGHCLWIYPNANPYLTSILQVFAFLGVEVFFVLSGFLIGGILYRLYVKEDFTVRTALCFLKRRWFRTLPLYYLVLLINIGIVCYYGISVPDFGQYFLFLQNFDSPMPDFFPESWSLSVEEFSYVLLPVFLLGYGMVFKPKNKPRFFMLTVVVLIGISILAKMIFHQQTHNTDIAVWNASLKSVVIYRLDAIFIGVACSWCSIHFQSLWMQYRKLLACIGFLYICFLFAGIGYFRLLIDSQPLFWNVCYLPLVSLAIAFFLPLLSGWKKWDSRLSRPITFISIISYSMYLLHYSLILQLMKNNFPITASNGLQLHLFTVAYIFLTIVCSSLVYRFFEKPIMDLRDK